MKEHFVIEDEVLDAFIRLPARQREQVFKAFQRITNEIHLSAAKDHQDGTGRWILRREIGSCTLWFWHDGPVHEVRIVDFQIHRSRR
ncbi:hypothetical protein [Brevifollis gellanilyticus]|uniref:Uncharacterized protein n=1 Tax=Brevifollis gellanilyticus TaxID=748831 RepID=A0A512MEA6_9BACT|nr:hypothetical protein [Brevifollis gellanilyticus]GEP45038.1 hypothetical protein BGE01nite_43290 [Brevifollis gellanilyticus]